MSSVIDGVSNQITDKVEVKFTAEQIQERRYSCINNVV